MPGFLVTFANPVVCTHGGPAKPVPLPGRVLAGGLCVVTLAHVYEIKGCTFPAMTSGAQLPCVVGTLATGTTRVFSMGMALALLPTSMPTSKGTPNPTPLIFAPAGQIRASAT